MAADIPLFIAFIYIFFTSNFYGWGILNNKLFINFIFALGIIYLLTHLLQSLIGIKKAVIFKYALLLMFIAIAVIYATFDFINLRNKTSSYAFINDSGLQVEIAGRFLLLSKNPYSESYKTTDLAKASYSDDANNKVNPALQHNAYPPFTVILSALGFRFFSQFFGMFDIRILFLVFYISVVVLTYLKFRLSENGLIFLILVGLNPIFLNYLMQGSNDIVVLALILWSLFFMERKMTLPSILLFAFSIAAKQTAWFAIPFYLIYLWKNFSGKEFIKYSVLTFGTAGIFYLPFAVWNFRALLDSLIFYMGGSLPTSYPIANFGLGTVLVQMGVIKSIYAYYPFWIWQGLAGLVVIIGYIFSYRKKQITVADMLYGYSLLLAVVWLFNRSMNFSYLGYLMVIISASFVWESKHIIKKDIL